MILRVWRGWTVIEWWHIDIKDLIVFQLLKHTVDCSEILHQLRLVVYPNIYSVLYILGAGFLPSTVLNFGGFKIQQIHFPWILRQRFIAPSRTSHFVMGAWSLKHRGRCESCFELKSGCISRGLEVKHQVMEENFQDGIFFPGMSDMFSNDRHVLLVDVIQDHYLHSPSHRLSLPATRCYAMKHIKMLPMDGKENQPRRNQLRWTIQSSLGYYNLSCLKCWWALMMLLFLCWQVWCDTDGVLYPCIYLCSFMPMSEFLISMSLYTTCDFVGLIQLSGILRFCFLFGGWGVVVG